MKIRLVFILLAFVSTITVQAISFDSLETSEARELYEIMAIDNCKDGAKGWWIDLKTESITFTVNGYLNQDTGEFRGCGTCEKCRSVSKSRTSNYIQGLNKRCIDRGGKVKSTTRGTLTEDLKQNYWKIKRSGINIKCQKWNPC